MGAVSFGGELLDLKGERSPLGESCWDEILPLSEHYVCRWSYISHFVTVCFVPLP